MSDRPDWDKLEKSDQSEFIKIAHNGQWSLEKANPRNKQLKNAALYGNATPQQKRQLRLEDWKERRLPGHPALPPGVAGTSLEGVNPEAVSVGGMYTNVGPHVVPTGEGGVRDRKWQGSDPRHGQQQTGEWITDDPKVPAGWKKPVYTQNRSGHEYQGGVRGQSPRLPISGQSEIRNRFKDRMLDTAPDSDEVDDWKAPKISAPAYKDIRQQLKGPKKNVGTA